LIPQSQLPNQSRQALIIDKIHSGCSFEIILLSFQETNYKIEGEKYSNHFFKWSYKHKKGVTEMNLFYASIVWALPISLFLWFIVIQMISIFI
jgi:hypothetical protein